MKMEDYDYDKPFTFKVLVFCLSVLITAISLISILVFLIFGIWDIVISEIEHFNLRMVITSVISFLVFSAVSAVSWPTEEEDDEVDYKVTICDQ